MQRVGEHQMHLELEALRRRYDELGADTEYLKCPWDAEDDYEPPEDVIQQNEVELDKLDRRIHTLVQRLYGGS